MKKIRIHPEMKKQIAKEFEVTYHSVTLSVEGFLNSDKAKSIRQRAYELLKQEAERLVTEQ